MRRGIVVLLLALASVTSADAQQLRWGGDAEGGAPFVEADPETRPASSDSTSTSRSCSPAGSAAQPRFVQVGFTSLDAAAARGDFDIGLSGIEDSPARRSRLAVTDPVLRVPGDPHRSRQRMAPAIGRWPIWRGGAWRRWVRRSRTTCWWQRRAEHGVVPVTYEDDVHPYSDLALGRVDAVLLDYVLAERGVRRNPGLMNQPTPVGVGHYVGVLAPGDSRLCAIA